MIPRRHGKDGQYEVTVAPWLTGSRRQWYAWC